MLTRARFQLYSKFLKLGCGLGLTSSRPNAQIASMHTEDQGPFFDRISLIRLLLECIMRRYQARCHNR